MTKNLMLSWSNNKFLYCYNENNSTKQRIFFKVIQMMDTFLFFFSVTDVKHRSDYLLSI